MPNVRRLVERYYEIYGRHDLEGLLAMMDDDVRIHFPVDETPKNGKEQIRAAWTLSFNVVIPDIRQELHTIVADGNHAAVQFTEYGTVHIPEESARKAGLAVKPRPYAMEMGSFYTFNDQGLIREIRSFWDTGNFARQLGIDIGIVQAMSRGSTQVLSPRLAAPPARRSRFPIGREDDVRMITVASFPDDLGAWDQDENPFYLEVFGEAEPLLDMTHAEVIPVGGSGAASTSPTPIYEYWWTIGHGGSKPEHRHLFEDREKLDLWHRLDDIAARVYLYFPISGGWRTQELTASAKYLGPVAQQSEWTEKAAAEWQRMQPILAGAGQAASALGVVPGVGTIAAGAAPLLSAVSKLQVGSVPQAVKGFDWYVEKVTVPPSAHHGVMQGVVWAIPKDMFELLGGRLTGSLALSFIPAAGVGQAPWAARPLPMLAHAAVYADGETCWVPAQNKFIELPLSPRTPAAAG